MIRVELNTYTVDVKEAITEKFFTVYLNIPLSLL